MIYLSLLGASSLSVSVHLRFCFSTGSRPDTGRKQQPADSSLPGSSVLYAQALLSSLEFPERQESGKALKIIPGRESETREVQQLLKVTQKILRTLGVALGLLALSTDHTALQNNGHVSHAHVDLGTDLP